MRELPLTISGAASALGLLAAVAQAEPITLSATQMDELTAGQAAATAVVTSTITPSQGTVTATVAVSTYISGPQGYIDACENAMSTSISSTSVTSTLTLSCVCETTTTGSASPPG
jgi:hypothetical protein